MVVSRERAKRASRNFHILCRKHTFIFNSLLVNHIFVNTTVLVFLTLIALFMTSYTDQKTRNLRTYLNNCKRAERNNCERAEKFLPFPVLTLLVNHIFVGAIPRRAPPPPPPGYASGAHATEIICSRAKRAAKTEN